MRMKINNGILRITPPPGSTVGTPSAYTIHYNTRARIDLNPILGWVIWAKQWNPSQLAIKLTDAATVAGCQALGAPNAVCYRPPLTSQTGPAVYRVFASIPAGQPVPGWTPASASLTVTP
jgi:hypothetical protein